MLQAFRVSKASLRKIRSIDSSATAQQIINKKNAMINNFWRFKEKAEEYG